VRPWCDGTIADAAFYRRIVAPLPAGAFVDVLAENLDKPSAWGGDAYRVAAAVEASWRLLRLGGVCGTIQGD
jgi:hypothetical protein